MCKHGKDGDTCYGKVYTCHRLYRVFACIYALLIEKDICDRLNVSVKLLCVYLCLSSIYLVIFSARVSSFSPYFCVVRTSVLSFPCDLMIFNYLHTR